MNREARDSHSLLRFVISNGCLKKNSAVIPVEKLDWADPTSPGGTARRHERHCSEPLIPARVKLSDCRKHANGVSNVLERSPLFIV
jgi:hypothetical protein